VGDTYGYLIDNAYIVDFENKVEFITLGGDSVNDNQIYNVSVYEYDKTGFRSWQNSAKQFIIMSYPNPKTHGEQV
jgi:hypothetical protein